ncbi:MAG: M23 family metallopeptidase [Bacilli bacterium]|nr:M23 family metallopeptidase [Bacilli bacterium]
MNSKQKIITFLLVAITVVILFLYGLVDKEYNIAKEVYQVYLNGEAIGTIADEDKLYDLIDNNQQLIKEKYNVTNVYPPNNFEIIKKYTYDEKLTTAEDIYNKIEQLEDFTIKGYVITINPNDPEKEAFTINVTDKKIFESAINKFINTFVDEEVFIDYMNGTQKDIVDTGSIIENMGFNETFKIKESLISVNEKIFTDEISLSQYLLFGDQEETKYYTIKAGDTITSVSEENKLNTEEFLIANPKYESEDSLLAINDQVNVTLIKPMISLTYQLYSVSDEEQYFEKKIVYDKSKPSSYSQITQSGVTGLTRLTERYTVTNGEQSQGSEVISKEVLREKVDQITTKGRRYYGVTGNYIDAGTGWAWPTNSGYRITSPYGYRWGAMHNAIDISGTGFNSPIYAANDGEVVVANKQCKNCSYWSLGHYVVIKHANNYYTLYAHMNSLNVSVGQTVSKGTIIGKMGETGRATGVHLHYSVSIGQPYSESYRYINPLNLYR